MMNKLFENIKTADESRDSIENSNSEEYRMDAERFMEMLDTGVNEGVSAYDQRTVILCYIALAPDEKRKVLEKLSKK